VRYHSWCPPEEAFDVADRMGIILHVEAPWWVFDAGEDPPRDAFLRGEVRRILDTYGNHPSFGFFVLGNELEGDGAWMEDTIHDAKQHDPRHLYTASTWHAYGAEDQFEVDTVRGLHGPTTNADFRVEAAARPVPLISHEIGQWSVYPRLKEIPKYTGVLRARNFEKIRDDLAGKHMLAQADDFTRASGLLAAELYKEEIEAMLRTGHAGFQMLDLHDFPGQGTAVVGMLDAFWESKGLVTPEAWRRFCGPTVPLARMDRRSWTTADTLQASVEVAHYGASDMPAARTTWTLADDAGRVLATGDLPTRDIPTGAVTPTGDISIPLAGVPAPARVHLTVSTNGAANDWSLWVYPPPSVPTPPAGVTVSRRWDDATRAALARGESVLLLPGPATLRAGLPGSFTTVFWSPVWFKSGALTMGLLCDPAHPALAGFPTEGHTDWQWYDLVTHSQTMILNALPENLQPIVQVVDNFTRNDRLGDIFEAKVGPGRLLVCSLDLSSDLAHRPAAAQMLRSLYAYTASAAFQPKVSLSAAALDGLFWSRPPIDRYREQPPALSAAVLNVRAAESAPAKSAAWVKASDTVTRQGAGFEYSVNGSTWRDATGAVWYDPADLRLTVRCPEGFAGVLHVLLQDFNSQNRMADVVFEGRPLGLVDKYDGPGVWLGIPVTAADSADGRLEVSIRPRGQNAAVAALALVANVS
jgi:hypothetical protein